jgi:hypothetical protein
MTGRRLPAFGFTHTRRPVSSNSCQKPHVIRPRKNLEKQLGLIERIGLQNYLQSQA